MDIYSALQILREDGGCSVKTCKIKQSLLNKAFGDDLITIRTYANGDFYEMTDKGHKTLEDELTLKSTTMKQTITIASNEENPEPVELIADSIIKISEGFEKINNSGLGERALILLLHDAIGVGNISKKQIQLVLKYAPKLKDYYTAPKKLIKKK